MERVERAEAFLLSALRGGLAHSYDVKSKQWVKAYPEVTGYVVSYFSKFCASLPSSVVAAANRLSAIQYKNGG